MADVTPAPGAPAPAAGGAVAPDKAAPPAPPPADPKTAAPPPAPAGAAKEKDTQDGPASFLGDAAKEAAKEKEPPPEEKEGDKEDSTADAGDAYELAMPEGVKADKPLLDAFTVKARELKLSKDQAQALADVAVARAVEGAKQAQVEAVQRAKDQRAALEADPEIGGAKLKDSQTVAKNFILRMDRETSGRASKVVQKLAAAGLGDDPDIAFFFTHQGRRMADDKSVSTTAPTGTTPSPQSVAQERLAKRYPSMNKKAGA